MLRELVGNSHEAVAIDLLQGDSFPGVAWRTGDLLNRATPGRIVAEMMPEACIHLAGIAFAPDGDSKPETMLSVNVLGTINVLEAFREHCPRSRVLVVSTGRVYGALPGEAALSEEAPLRPLGLYAVSKAAADMAALGYAESGSLPVMTARPNNHTGPGQSERFVIPGLVSQARAIAAGRLKPVIRVGNLESERDFSDVRDVVRAYRLLIERGQPGLAYNIASQHSASIREILDEICGLAEITPRMQVDPARFRPKDRSPLLDISRITGHTGWRAEISRAETLRDMVKGSDE